MSLAPVYIPTRPVGTASPALSGRGLLVTVTSAGSAQTVNQNNDPGVLLAWRIWVVNNDSGVQHKATFLWGGTVSPDDYIPCLIRPEQGPQLVIDGLLLQSDLIIGVFADSGSKLTVFARSGPS